MKELVALFVFIGCIQEVVPGLENWENLLKVGAIIKEKLVKMLSKKPTMKPKPGRIIRAKQILNQSACYKVESSIDLQLLDTIKKVPFFNQCRLWKSFHVWRNNIRHRKITLDKRQLAESLFITKKPLRIMLLELFKMTEKLSTMAFLSMKPHHTYDLKSFLGHQDRKLKEVYKKLRQFEEMIAEMTVSACRSTLIEAGFSPDEYPEEMKYYMKALEVPLGDLLTQTVDVLNYPGQWLSYSLQLQKRKLCARLTNFVHLIDYYIQRTYSDMYKNTMLMFMCELSTRVKEIPEEFFKAPEYLTTLETLRATNERANGPILVSDSTEPVFNVGCGWTTDTLVFSPTRDKFLKMTRSLLTKWEKTIYAYKNLLPRPIFDPYTQPIINGAMRENISGDGPQMALLLHGDADLKQIRDTIVAACDHGLDVCRTYIEKFDHIRAFCVINQVANLKKFRYEKDVRAFANYLKTFHTQIETIEKVEDDQCLGLYRMNNSILREKAYPSVKRCLVVLNRTIPKFGVKNVKKLSKTIKSALKTLDKYPENADEYVDYLNYLDSLLEQMEGIEEELGICTETYELLEMYSIPVPPQDITAFKKLAPLLDTLRFVIEQRVAHRGQLTTELVDQFKNDAKAIFAEMARIRSIAQAAEVLDPKTDAVAMCEKLTQCRNTLIALQERAAKFNNYQRQLKLDVTNYDELDALLVNVRLRHQLWESVSHWEVQKEEWYTMPFNTLDHEELTKEVNKYVKSIQQLEKGLPENAVVPKLKAKVQKLRGQLPLIANLHNPNLKRRHWDILEAALNRNLTDEDVTLQSLLEETGIEDYAELIQDVSSQASAEFSLEALLKKVEDSWKDVEFIVLPHKDQRDNFILGGTDDIQVLLDDSNIHMATIASSRHVGPIQHKVEEWTRLLDLFGRTLDEWLNFQRNYIYLDTIFSAPDIQRQLPTESKLFTQVDKTWRDVMQKTNRMPAALRAATAPGLLEQLETGNQMLEQIMKCLDDYLESKRVIFPRFYFLSNEELLEILAQTRNPQAVQPHLRKCFDAIQRLEFGGPANSIAVDVLAMFSPEDERVALTKGLKARGNVEEWLGKVEDSMFNSLKKCMRNALTDYHIFEREEWLQKFPSQCVLTISQLMWAQKVHAILDAPGNKLKGMKDFETENFENLNKLAAMVRGPLKPLVRAVLCAVITIDVHARDIITSLVEKKVDTSSNFEWLKQLRYYWDAQQEVALARMANAQYFYGYEYLGASPRLVITPLTDRCYLCLMGALQLDLGGAPAGPAGTGKTETTKDLAKSLAFMCVVFNCSEGLDFKMMGRFFAGLAQSGGWCCFDEFNRIDIEVLSVIAQQLITIRLAKVAKASRFMFEGREIKLVKTCAAFITMNPGYAGRTELPDNLKSLFRPLSMMVPDYTLIAEVILYSEGFESSKTLANKMTQMYKLCSEQLSQQDHYDFGMRAVKSVLVMAGSLKRSNPDVNENIVLIRALRDSNSAKFLAADNILFNGIIQDLFPGVVIPEQDYGVLQKQAIKCALDKGLQAPECFIRKLIQFFDTLVVRHGVMLVGPTGGGKTSIYETLKASLTALYSRKVEGPFYKPVDTFVLNPKAISIGELYGEVNPLTLEWRDGLFGVMFRAAVKPKATYHQWIVCDGPVDAIWIENLNTVLDDNKMLCLANSERIKLTNWVRMVFEVQDLSQASPATVSRCGMVYVDPVDMGWAPYVESWLQRLPSSRDDLKPYLQYLFGRHFEYGLQFVKKSCQEIMAQSTIGKVSMTCSILQAMLTKRNIDYNLDKPEFLQVICQVFMFAYLWSVGGNIHEKDHEAFSQFVRTQFETEEFGQLPKTGQLWSFYINIGKQQMELWETILPKYVYSQAISFVDVLVPTIDTVRFGFLMELLLEVNRAVLFTGPTGTGKSAIAKYVLTSIAPKYDYLPVFINFSAQTTSKRTQEMIEGKLERRKKALLSAPMGKKVIVLIDDINMPKLDRYGSQPSIELVRQLLDFNGCYDRTKLFWKELQNVLISAACAPPGGGRNPITPRLLRHFCMLAIPTPNQTVLAQIYRAVMKGFLDPFDPEIKAMADSIVSAAIDTYQFMTQTFLPTPAKSHYVFNMRDLSKCIQGVLQANRSVVVMKKSMVRLFYHEAQRVFHDRLTDVHDRTIFCNSLAELCTKTFEEPINAADMKGLVYGDFLKMGVDRELRVYDEITNKEKLKQVLNDYLDEYNISTPKEMQLVFFEDAIEHVTRIARILRTDRGNALLVGVGGSGKQSLTRLSSYVSGYQCFQIELMRGYDYSSFHDDLKILYEIAGMKNEPIVFLFTDTQIAYEEFLEDINNILNSGEVPNLLAPEDLERLMAPVRADAKSIGIEDRDAVYDYFIRRIRSNLHIVLCMSPVGDNFRIRTRMFPSIINCCTIDWYNEWPTEALLSVAKSFMSKIELGKGVTPDAMADISVLVHESVTEMAERFYNELKRRYYITPSSYLELINLYTSMLHERREKIRMGKARIQNGLAKLLETNVLVKEMRAQLNELEPILIQKSDGVEVLMVKLAEDQAEADIVRTKVQEEEAVAKDKAIETQAIAEDAQKDLAVALPALNAAAEALNSLDKNDINEIRSFIKPPPLVKLVMSSVCALFGVKEDWNSAKILLTDAAFLKKLLNYDAGSVSDAKIKALKPYIDDPKFQPAIVEKVSKACKCICLWARAVNEYAKVNKVVEPKRQRYATAQAELDQVMETLKKAQTELNTVEKKIAKLEKIYQDTLNEKQELEDNMELTAARLRRAGKLTSALASEQTRWAESVQQFDADTENLIGDVFVGAACVAYIGAFSHHYRQLLITDWMQRCVELGLPITKNFSLATFADPFEIRVWNSHGLPKDYTSTENAILATRGRRWPLMIDPQDQGNRWVKQMENEKGLKVLRLTDANFMRTLENCVRLGQPALLEEVGETLDPSLEPILLRQTFVQAGRTMIRLGDTNVDYDANFRFYITTKMANPVYLPEVCIKVTLINFTVTMKGLEDQLLGDVVGIERSDLETQRQTLVTQINSDKNQLVSLESKILKLLFQSEGNILDDEELINALNDSKETSTAIVKRLADAEIAEESITAAREKYRSIATRGSVLYFVVAQLAELDPMYQYSLKYFTQVFNHCIASTPSTEDLEERLRILKRETTLATYTNISRGLFEKDKLVFSFILCTDILRSREVITEDEWNFFLRGGVGLETRRSPKPAQATWISKSQWNYICDLENTFDFMQGLSRSCLTEAIKIHIGGFRTAIYGPRSPTDKQKKTSEKWDKTLSKFQKLILVKCIAEEKLVPAITEFVHQELGQKFIESPTIDLDIIFEDLNKSTPLIFVLSVGSDPMASFYRFANEQGVADRVHSISLGQGQGPIAEGMIKSAALTGDWVFLQNCHLASSWLPQLERIVKRMNEFNDDINESFRLFLSSMPTPSFPVSVLQESVKVTNEPPKGIRANVKRALLDMEKEFFEDNILQMDWKRIIVGICVFHAVIQERKKFGPLGWNIKYEFNDSDRQCCLLNLEMFCKDGTIPWDALEYITGQITYGGRITDPWDQRTVTTILKTFFSKKSLNPEHRYSKSGIYYAPSLPKLAHYLRFVEKFPIIDEPEIFGMHQNANISFQIQESSTLLTAILSAQPRIAGGSAAASNDEIVYDLAVNIEKKLPQKFDLDKANPKLFMPDPKGRTPSMSVFLQQEVDRFNRLIGVMKTSLDQLKKGIKGLVVMSEDLEKMYLSFINNQVPDTWTRVAYGSTKSLAAWVNDLLLRIVFINGWLAETNSPTSYWISGFFFQQGFLTAVLQTYARKYSVPIDQLKFVYAVAPIIKEQRADLDPVIEKTIARPHDGVFIHGLFLEAARWNMEEMTLDDALPGQMNSVMPIIHFLPVQNPAPPEHTYNCPLYKTPVRAGVLSTTGHSTNFIVAIDLPTQHEKDYWILNGTALLSQLTE